MKPQLVEVCQRQRQRMAELEQRVLDGTDDPAYCLRWIGIHQRILDAVEGATDANGTAEDQ